MEPKTSVLALSHPSKTLVQQTSLVSQVLRPSHFYCMLSRYERQYFLLSNCRILILILLRSFAAISSKLDLDHHIEMTVRPAKSEWKFRACCQQKKPRRGSKKIAAKETTI
jgi:hypothetical protein